MPSIAKDVMQLELLRIASASVSGKLYEHMHVLWHSMATLRYTPRRKVLMTPKGMYENVLSFTQ